MMNFKSQLVIVLLMLWQFTATAWAEEAGVALKPDDIKAEPFKDAETVGTITKGDSVSILGKKSGWLQVKTSQATGWVRILSVRRGTAGGSKAAAEIAGVANVATGRAGTGQVVSTTGVRGLGEEYLKGAKFNEAELKKADASAVTAAEAKQFAATGALVVRSVDWLPAPQPTTNQGR